MSQRTTDRFGKLERTEGIFEGPADTFTEESVTFGNHCFLHSVLNFPSDSRGISHF